MAINKLNENLVHLAAKLKDCQYCLRGTTSLILQNIQMNVDDLDILCNKETALLANDLFKDYLVEPVSYKESAKFKSYFGKFLLNGINVEFMGDWQIKNKNGEWSEIFDGSRFNIVDLNGTIVKVSKIEDELKMFLLNGRFTAYQKIKKQLPPFEKIKPKENSEQPGLF